MKSGRNATQAELNYGLRRVVYDTLVAAKSIDSLSTIGRDYAGKEMAKMAALIMARNLHAFLFVPNYSKTDDINVTDFNLSNWQPSSQAHLSPNVYERIHKIVGHIVASKPNPFKDDKDVNGKLIPLIEQACDFVRQCRAQGKAEYTGTAKYYVRRLNGLLSKFGLAKLPQL